MATESTAVPRRPLRADAQRNYDKLVATAREVFRDQGTSVSLEEIAKNAGVGIGTLYRHFPDRRHLLVAVYVDEVEAIAAAARERDHLEPWEALSGWLHEYVGFAATKRALADELWTEGREKDDVFQHCRTTLIESGGALMRRAQAAGDIRADVEFLDIGRMVGGIATIHNTNPEEQHRLVDLALDGLRYRGGEPS